MKKKNHNQNKDRKLTKNIELNINIDTNKKMKSVLNVFVVYS